MTDDKIKRISELGRKSRTPAGLSEEEKAEQAVLRREYIDSMKASLRAHLDNTVILDEHGNRRSLKRR